MNDLLESWLKEGKTRRHSPEELHEFMVEYFAGDINEDIELACAMGLKLEEIRNLRRQLEA
ncbi:MAG: hypothetical protein AB1767_13055 [Bacillota bacterium]